MSEAGIQRALVPVARGTEEIEAVTLIDVLRRAGADVEVAACGKRLQVTCSRGTVLVADCLLESCINDEYSLIVLPGGADGAAKMHDDTQLIDMLHRQNGSGRLIGAICAAPALVLAPHGLLEGRKATCHPDYAKSIPDDIYVDERIVPDGNIVTSQGPGTALEFALFITEMLFDGKKRRQIAEAMVVKGFSRVPQFQTANEHDKIEGNLREYL